MRWRSPISGLLLCLFFLPACTGLYFAPQQKLVLTPDRIGVQYRDLSFRSVDGVTLHGWLLPANAPHKGRVLFLHGNGENISTHFASVYWLPAAGYDVLLLDYRGYGRSGGKPALPDVLLDIDAAWQTLQQQTDNTLPAFIFGQSLGAALSYQWLSTRQPQGVTGVIYDSGFARYPDMVRKVLQGAWLTRWASTPLSWFFSHAHDPERVAAMQPAIPRLFLHSRDDNIVPLEQGEALFRINRRDACLLAGRGPHITMTQQEWVREQVLAFMTAPDVWMTQCDLRQQALPLVQPVWIPLPPLQ